MKDNLLKIIEHYGVLPQLKYFQSEVFELNEAIISTNTCDYYGINERDYEETKEHIAEEIADVLVMLIQFKEQYQITDKQVKEVMENKINRQLERIQNEKK